MGQLSCQFRGQLVLLTAFIFHRASEVTFPHGIKKSFLLNLYVLSILFHFPLLFFSHPIQQQSLYSEVWGAVLLDHRTTQLFSGSELAVRSFKLKIHHTCKWSHFKALN